MGRVWRIGFLALAFLVACNGNKQAPELIEGPTKELSAVDSLMWQQPDSALAVLQNYLACRDAMIASPETPDGDFIEMHAMRLYDQHYANLLLAELLYKNYYDQTNRPALRQAVAYFDSLTFTLNDHSSLRRLIAGGDPLSPTRNDQLFFLSARAHYINGVGYYEHDSVVDACKEYLKALEVMEEHFEEKEMVGKKAKFMALSYNRLGDMFYGQLLVESAVDCYKNALAFCLREPTSKYGISVIMYNLGLQFDMIGQKDSAIYYYDKALDNMPDFDNVHYRDILATKAVLDYNSGIDIDSVISDLKHLVSLSKDQDEKLTRFLTIGSILYEETLYDSSLLYLEPVFEHHKDIQSKILAAENLCTIHKMKKDSIEFHRYSSFLAGFAMKEIEEKSDISKINKMFQNHKTQRQENLTDKRQTRAISNTIVFVLLVSIAITIVVATIMRRKNKKQIKEIIQHHNRNVKNERKKHEVEQLFLSERLKESNREIQELQDQLKQQNDRDAAVEPTISFDEEPICRLIMERVKEGQFKSQMDCNIYKDFALSKEQLMALHGAANRHFSHFTERLAQAYPDLTKSDLDYCCLYLLGLTDADIAALMQRAYSTVSDRSRKLKTVFGSNSPLSITLHRLANQETTI